MKLYINTGTHETEVWSVICNIGDLSVGDLKRAVALLERRCSNWGKNLASLMDPIGFNFKLIHDVDAVNFNVLLTAFMYGTVYEFAIMNDDILADGAEGLRLPAIIEEFPWDQPLKDVSSHAVKLSLAYKQDVNNVEIDPEWVIAASGDVTQGGSFSATTTTTAAPTTTTTT
jgi:hypothetical protein